MEQVGEQHKGWPGGDASVYPQTACLRPDCGAHSAHAEPAWSTAELLWQLLWTKGAPRGKVTALPGPAHIS